MKRFGVLVATGVFTLFLATAAQAQAPAAPHGAQPPPAGGPAATPMPMMDMCAQMMGGAPPADSKERAAMMEMRGEMMKAMGDIMTKHARRMQGVTGN
jgi:hypothetical protein